jgi:hypothetical protein
MRNDQLNFAEIADRLAAGRVIPYLGPGVLSLAPEALPFPDSMQALVQRLTAKSSVPHKIRNNLTAAAQFIENFKHRKTLSALMTQAFDAEATPTALHRWLAGRAGIPLIVDTWYDDLMQRALNGHGAWGQVQGVSRAERPGVWVQYAGSDGAPAAEADAKAWTTLLYKPLGSVSPAKNFLVSDSDYVEVLTEIDIQTPIPAPVQEIRRGRHFLFLGCRFRSQLERIFAGQIMKRSSDTHWAVLPGPLTRNEERFLERQNVRRIDTDLQEFVPMMTAMQ